MQKDQKSPHKAHSDIVVKGFCFLKRWKYHRTLF